MKLSRNVYQRLKSLKLNLDEVDKCKDDLKRDYIKDVGLEYDIWYPDNEESQALFREGEDLYELRKDHLFKTVFNFSQNFYSLKEYLIEYEPKKVGVIEDFFSNENNDQLSRKQISNDLKHNPNNDLEFDSRIVKKESIIEHHKTTHISYIGHSWFYGKVETVEYCHKLYAELIQFLEKNF